MTHDELQLLGRAAGLHFDPTRKDPRGLWVVVGRHQEDQALWNPETSTDDAMTLARRLRMRVEFLSHTLVVSVRLSNDESHGRQVGYTSDPLPILRDAICQVALSYARHHNLEQP